MGHKTLSEKNQHGHAGPFGYPLSKAAPGPAKKENGTKQIPPDSSIVQIPPGVGTSWDTKEHQSRVIALSQAPERSGSVRSLRTASSEVTRHSTSFWAEGGGVQHETQTGVPQEESSLSQHEVVWVPCSSAKERTVLGGEFD